MGFGKRIYLKITSDKKSIEIHEATIEECSYLLKKIKDLDLLSKETSRDGKIGFKAGED